MEDLIVAFSVQPWDISASTRHTVLDLSLILFCSNHFNTIMHFNETDLSFTLFLIGSLSLYTIAVLLINLREEMKVVRDR